METLQKNPYQTTLTTAVKEHSVHENETILTPSDTILPDYEKYRLLPEAVQVDGILIPPENLLPNGSLRIPRVIHRKEITISIPWEGRRFRQRMVTARLLLVFLAKSYFHKSLRFTTDPKRENAFSLFLPGSFVPSDVPLVVRLLRRRLLRWSAAGLNIRTNAKGETSFFAMASLSYMGPHLFHTSELGDFRMENARLVQGGLTLTLVLLPVQGTI